MRGYVSILVFGVLACGGSGSGGTQDGGCDPSCEAVMHFVGNVGIPADIDRFTYAMCTAECTEVEVEVPATEVTQASTGDPLVSVTVTRTNEDYYMDLQGVFAFDGTWSSTVERLETDEIVGVRITRPDGGNIAATLRDLDPEEADGMCGCPTIELDI